MANGITQGVQVSNWRAHQKHTLRGFFTVTLPSGMVINDLSLHEKDGKRWINTPSREWKDQNGDTQYTPIITFIDRETTDRFRDLIVAVLDKYREVHNGPR